MKEDRTNGLTEANAQLQQEIAERKQAEAEREPLLAAERAQGHSRLVLDASQMEYISSAGLRVLLFAQREARQLGGEVRVFGLDAQVRRTFEMTGFGELLPVSNTRQEAMEGW